jgi:hypothetical protein
VARTGPMLTLSYEVDMPGMKGMRVDGTLPTLYRTHCFGWGQVVSGWLTRRRNFRVVVVAEKHSTAQYQRSKSKPAGIGY